MKYNTFGATNQKVSALTLGTWGIGGAGWDYNPDETKLETIAAAIDTGINFFDTAPAYNGGVAERLLGEAVKRSGKRSELLIATKCGNDFIDGQYVRDAHPDKIRAQIDRSLTNLQTDYIDLLLLHWPDGNVPAAETFGAMQEARDAGKIRMIGVCNHTIEQLDEACACTKIDALQMHYSMLVREHEEVLRYAADQGIATMGYGPLGGGILTGRYRTLTSYEEMDNRNRFYQYFKEPGFTKAMKLLETLEKVAAVHDATLSEVVLNWAAAQPFLTTVLFGTQKKERLLTNCRAFDWSLAPEEMNEIDTAIRENIG